MAKNQNLALNPSKVSGGCGRLLCCLTYEDETYTIYPLSANQSHKTLGYCKAPDLNRIDSLKQLSQVHNDYIRKLISIILDFLIFVLEVHT